MVAISDNELLFVEVGSRGKGLGHESVLQMMKYGRQSVPIAFLALINIGSFWCMESLVAILVKAVISDSVKWMLACVSLNKGQCSL